MPFELDTIGGGGTPSLKNVASGAAGSPVEADSEAGYQQEQLPTQPNLTTQAHQK